MTSHPRRARPGLLATAAFILAAVLYIALRVHIFSAGTTVQLSDSDSFLEKAVTDLGMDFFFDEGRFFVVPLLYKAVYEAFGYGRVWNLARLQVIVSIAAWLVFAWTFARVLAPAGLGFAGFVAALVLSLSLDITMWDRTIMSESFTTSFFVVFLAAWMLVGEKFTWLRATALFIGSMPFAFTREANGLMLLPFAVILLAWMLCYVRERRHQVFCAVIAASWFLVTAGSTVISQAGERWLFPLLNVIGTRVLTTPDRLAFYEAAGMPINPRLLAMKGEMASGQNWAFYQDPELIPFRHWIRRVGRSVFARDLVSNPVRTLQEPMGNLEAMVCPGLSAYNLRSNVPSVLPDIGQSRSCSPFWSRVALFGSLLVGSILLGLALVKPGRFTPAESFKLLTLAAMLLGWPPFLWFTWQVIGGMELDRHALSGTLQFRLGVLLAAGYLAMAIRQRRQLAPAPLVPARPAAA